MMIIMNNYLRHFLLLALCFVGRVNMAAAETLEQAWLISSTADRTIEAAQIRVEAAEAELAASQGTRWPTVVARASATQYNETPAFDFSGAGLPGQLPLFDGSSQLVADARITLPIFTFGMISNGVQAAESGVRAQQLRANAHAQDVRLAVATAYVSVLRARSALEVANSRVRSLVSHADDVEDMFAAGAVARNDLLAAQVSLADVQQYQLQAQNGVDISEAAYNKSLGRVLTDTVSLDTELPGLDPRLEPDSLTALTATALENRAELAGLQSAAESIDSQAQSTRARSRPQFAIIGGYTAMENNFLNREDFWSIGLGMQWDIFDSDRSRERANALFLQSTALYRDYQELQSVVEFQVRSTWLRFNESNARIKLTERAIEQADENLRVTRDRYRNGEGTNTEVLNAEGLRTISRSNYDNAQYDAALARYRLARATGLL
ncbi:MAG: TolC family protein [Gammaproteobacteria bacterium]|nr:MAG: TolC family protein [Gammaproteobacteria bacterium]